MADGLKFKVPPGEAFYHEGKLIRNGGEGTAVLILEERAKVLRVKEMIPEEDSDLSQVHLLAFQCGLWTAGITEPRPNLVHHLLNGVADEVSVKELRALTVLIVSGDFYKALKELKTIIDRRFPKKS